MASRLCSHNHSLLSSTAYLFTRLFCSACCHALTWFLGYWWRKGPLWTSFPWTVRDSWWFDQWLSKKTCSVWVKVPYIGFWCLWCPRSSLFWAALSSLRFTIRSIYNFSYYYNAGLIWIQLYSIYLNQGQFFLQLLRLFDYLVEVSFYVLLCSMEVADVDSQHVYSLALRWSTKPLSDILRLLAYLASKSLRSLSVL